MAERLPTPLQRITLVVCAGGLAFGLVVIIGFGANTSCSTAHIDTECDAIDDRALAGRSSPSR